MAAQLSSGARVDVLRVMRRSRNAASVIAREFPTSTTLTRHADECEEAIAAVAELVASMRQVLIEATESPNSDAIRVEVIEGLARAALAPFSEAGR